MIISFQILSHYLKTVTLQTISSSFNSLFRVLFIFPSRYLFAIGFSSIFSFRWNLPPTQSCNPKQLDSLVHFVYNFNIINLRGYHSLWRCISTILDFLFQIYKTTIKLQFSFYGRDFNYELFLIHSQLLKESQLVSFPRLNKMLQSSR